MILNVIHYELFWLLPAETGRLRIHLQNGAVLAPPVVGADHFQAMATVLQTGDARYDTVRKIIIGVGQRTANVAPSHADASSENDRLSTLFEANEIQLEGPRQ
ncbi:MAG TPA: hypothetical protein VEY71_03455 [Chitinophagales bacterium]|nr:hypothetical protein [Chitinophagales bacterium]